MTTHIERRLDALEALERHRASDWRAARELSDEELTNIIVDSLGYLPDGEELERIASEKGAEHDND